jgi:hypothetical protein
MLTDSDLVQVVVRILTERGGLIEVNHALGEELSKTIIDAVEEELGHIIDKQAAEEA